MADCVFCQLVSGHAEVSLVYEDERTVTFTSSLWCPGTCSSFRAGTRRF
jgi:hypothetical protein